MSIRSDQFLVEVGQAPVQRKKHRKHGTPRNLKDGRAVKCWGQREGHVARGDLGRNSSWCKRDRDKNGSQT